MTAWRIRPWTWKDWTAACSALAALSFLIAIPKYSDSAEKMRELTLRQDLQVMRTAIKDYRADKGESAKSLEQLVNAGYLRVIPTDPITGKIDWLLTPDPPKPSENIGGIADVHSASNRIGRDGVPYTEW